MSQTTPHVKEVKESFSSAEANNAGSSYSFPHLMVESIMTDLESFFFPFSLSLLTAKGPLVL